jgi:ribonuclease-3
MGAIYLESGLESVRNITVELLEHVHEEISLDSLFKDYKTSLQELTQAHYGITPDYQLVAAHGPDHKKEFEVAAFIDGKRYSSALGKSKKHAQQEAAKIALDILSKELK